MKRSRVAVLRRLRTPAAIGQIALKKPCQLRLRITAASRHRRTTATGTRYYWACNRLLKRSRRGDAVATCVRWARAQQASSAASSLALAI
jgi:hypothetical protein